MGLEGFSHVWVIFMFHQNQAGEVRFNVTPPYQDGAQFGLWATRTPNRTSHIGQSVVELERIEKHKGKLRLYLKGIDLIEGTPIIDIKPYLPYVDAIPDAGSGFTKQPQARLQVNFTTQAEQQLNHIENNYPELRLLIVEVLQLDPRRNHKPDRLDDNVYYLRLYDLRVVFKLVDEQNINVLEVLPCAEDQIDTPGH